MVEEHRRDLATQFARLAVHICLCHFHAADDHGAVNRCYVPRGVSGIAACTSSGNVECDLVDDFVHLLRILRFKLLKRRVLNQLVGLVKFCVGWLVEHRIVNVDTIIKSII